MQDSELLAQHLPDNQQRFNQHRQIGQALLLSRLARKP